MRIGWIGFHMEGIPALRAVLERGFPIVAIVTLSSEASARLSGPYDYSAIGQEFGIPVFEVDNINSETSLRTLSDLSLDLAFVIGWTQLVGPSARKLIPHGLIGAHASLLPRNRGRAPVNWSLIKGERETGNTLLWLGDSVDGGDVIDMTRIQITPYDSCLSIYEHVAESNRAMILRLLPKLLDGERPATRQPPSDDPVLSRRRPSDGRLDWSTNSGRVYDFVRALTRPYPGAFSWLGGQRWTIWACALPPERGSVDGRPGEVIGSVVSPVEEACGQAVWCGQGAVTL
ncbi:MAG TPA: methionyl-tRNA formyltransferase, partial [Methylomirabilota bacterium]|nr:methionyl-tRNA formyltransferase [Methylomirabilota bacterium]